MSLFEFVYPIINRHLLHKRKSPVLVGVSGGPDSMALVDILLKSGCQLIIAHFNHGIRPEAAADEEFVNEFASSRGITCVSEAADVVAYSRHEKLSLEDAGRRLRYRFLFSRAREFGAQAVAVGHNENDQVETILLHLLRGAGLSGLSGMQMYSCPNPWSNDIPLFRPMLICQRSDIEAYLSAHDIDYRLDSSNAETRYLRNRIRHIVIPELEKINPNLQIGLVRMAEVLQGDLEVVQLAAERAWREVLKFQGSEVIGLDRKAMKAQKIGLQRRLVLMACKRLLTQDRAIGFDQINFVVDEISSSKVKSEVHLSAGIYLTLDADVIWIGQQKAVPTEGNLPLLPEGFQEPINLPLPGSIELGFGWRLNAEYLDRENYDWPDEEELRHEKMHAWLSIGEKEGQLQVRSRLPGDQFRLFGLGGHRQKLSDFMINVKIPRMIRDRWPLVIMGTEIIWIPGWRIASGFEITSTTRGLVHLWLEKQVDRTCGG